MNICWDVQHGLQHATSTESAGAVTPAAATVTVGDDILSYEPEFKVLICKQHQYAVRNLYNHLRDEHKTIPIVERRVIVERYTRCELEEPAKVQLPQPLGPFIEALGRPVKALQCDGEACGFISINRQAMKKHCNQAHD